MLIVSVHYAWCLTTHWWRPLLLIEAAQSRPPSSLGPSDSADNVGARRPPAPAHAHHPPSPCCMTWQFRQPAVFCQCSGGGDTARGKLRLSSTFGQVGVPLPLRSQSLHYACTCWTLPLHSFVKENVNRRDQWKQWLGSCLSDRERSGLRWTAEQASLLENVHESILLEIWTLWKCIRASSLAPASLIERLE